MVARALQTFLALSTLSLASISGAMVDAKHSASYELLFAGYTGLVSRYTFTPPSSLVRTGTHANGTFGKSPSWISFSPKHPVAYVTDEDSPGRVFAVSPNLAPEGSSTQRSNGSSTGGNGPVSSEVVGNLLFVANYNTGSASVYDLDEHTGIPAGVDPGQVFQFEREPKGSIGPISSRQDHSYAHEVSADPRGRFVYVPDLGADRVHRLRVPAHGGKAKDVRLVGDTAVKAGAGPRHISFHEDGHQVFAYLACELDTTLVAYRVNEQDGSLEQVGEPQRVLPAGRDAGGNSTVGHALTTSEVAVSPDGRFVYVGCRGDPTEDHVAIFRRDSKTGSVSWSEWVESGGRNLRHFSLSPDPHARYLAAGHQNTGNVTILERDEKTGSLRRLATAEDVDMVAFAGFVPAHRHGHGASA
ncbi:unnamed protein product [Parajaminaea phylloscopi]